jgi:hypothetical protein
MLQCRFVPGTGPAVHLINIVQHLIQGNEADYIIITLVRTEAMGFLKNNRRANVLLTRCKKGMFVMTSRKLMMQDRSRETLLGKFAFMWDASQVSVDRFGR